MQLLLPTFSWETTPELSPRLESGFILGIGGEWYLDAGDKGGSLEKESSSLGAPSPWFTLGGNMGYGFSLIQEGC